MRDDVKQGLGCGVGIAGVLFGGGLLLTGLITAIFTATTGFVIAGIGIVTLAGSAIFAAIKAERTKEAATKAWATREYKSRLDEIEKLANELNKLATPERLSERGAADLTARLSTLKSRTEEILKSLLELDKYLKDRRNSPASLERERRDLAKRMVGADAESEAVLKQNLEAVNRTEAFLERARADRKKLIANLDKVLYGLRNSKAQLLAEVAGERATKAEELAGDEVSSSIQNDIKEISSSIKAVDGMRAEIEDLTRDRAKKAAQRQVN